MLPDGPSAFESEALGEGVVSFFFTCFALVAVPRFVSEGVRGSDSKAGSGGFGGVLVADFLDGGVFLAVADLGVSELRVLMLTQDDWTTTRIVSQAP